MSKTGAILGYVKASLSAPFQEERLGQGLYLGGCNVTIKMGILVQFLSLKFRQILFFLGRGVSKTGSNVLGYVKLRPQEYFFTRDCNVICRSYCVAIAMKICNTATPIHYAMAKFADR